MELPRTDLCREIREQPYFVIVGNSLVSGETTDDEAMLPLPHSILDFLAILVGSLAHLLSRKPLEMAEIVCKLSGVLALTAALPACNRGEEEDGDS